MAENRLGVYVVCFLAALGGRRALSAGGGRRPMGPNGSALAMGGAASRVGRLPPGAGAPGVAGVLCAAA